MSRCCALAVGSLMVLGACSTARPPQATTKVPPVAATPGPAAAPVAAATAEPALVPRPERISASDGAFVLRAGVSIALQPDSPALREIAGHLADRALRAGGLSLAIEAGPARDQSVSFALDEGTRRLGPEGYTLDVDPRGVRVRAAEPAGLFFGMQTLLQLLPAAIESTRPVERPGAAWIVAGVRIEDRPRFPWRGMHLDVSRHFFDKAFVKRYIELLALHKLNVFHFHLVDDHGWRIEIKKYPRLTSVGGFREDRRAEPWALHEDWRRKIGKGEKPYGGFYTQDDIREIVEHARKHHITVVPEIEVPGHSQAALAAYPELSCAKRKYQPAYGALYEFSDPMCPCKPETYRFLEDVLTEVMALFPSPHIHLGADEVRKVSWGEYAGCTAMMKREGLTTLEQLQSHMIKRVAAFVTGKGRKVIGWEEMMEGGVGGADGAPAGSVVMAWKGDAAVVPAIKAGHDTLVVTSDRYYFGPNDAARTGYEGLRQVYDYEPVPRTLNAAEAAHVLGVEAALWTEPVQTPELAELSVLPQLAALAETGWSAPARRDFASFQARLRGFSARYEALRLAYFVPAPAGPEETQWFLDQARVELGAAASDLEIRYTLDGSEPGPGSERYQAPLVIKASSTLRARTFLPSGRGSNPRTFTLTKVAYRDGVTPPAAGTQPGLDYVYREGPVRSARDVGTMKVIRRGVMEKFGLPPEHRAEKFGAEFTGFLRVEADGLYQLCVSSNDGALLFVGDALVVDNDDLHGLREKCGGVALRAGLHALRLQYFNYAQNMGLSVAMGKYGAGTAEIPPALLSHAPTARSAGR